MSKEWMIKDVEFEGSLFSDTLLVLAKDEERLQQIFEKSKLMRDMYMWVDHFYPDWEPDWKSTNNRDTKCAIFRDDFTAYADKSVNRRDMVFGISVPTFKAAEDMLTEFKERIEKWY